MHPCLWCDTPCEGPNKLCLFCRGGAATDNTYFYCWKNESHLRTLGLECAECFFEAERRARIRAQNAPIIASLQAIREKLISEDWHKPWPGCEHGKALFGMMLDGALKDLSQ